MPQGHAWQTGPPGTKREIVRIKTFVVRAAVAEDVGHAAQGLGVDGKSWLDPNSAGDAAHTKNSKSEYRNPKQITKLNYENPKVWSFAFHALNLFRMPSKTRLGRARVRPILGFVRHPQDFDIRF
jgi:hypothetical protein